MTIAQFNCPWDKTNKVLTICTSVVLTVTYLFVYYELFSRGSPAPHNWILFASFGFVAILLGMAVVSSPRRVDLTDTHLIIHCIVWTKRIDRREILLARPFEGKASVRTCGSGGFFGYLWWFYSKEAGGAYFSYVTHRGQMTFLRVRDEKYVISCERREELLALLR